MTKRWPAPLSQRSVTGALGVRGGAVGSPGTVRVGQLDALTAPAEAGEIGVLRAARAEQADRRAILGDRFLVGRQQDIVDARALQVDRSLELGRIDRARGLSLSTSVRSRIALGPSTAGPAPGCGSGVCWPPAILVTGGLAAGKSGWRYRASRRGSRWSAPRRGRCCACRSRLCSSRLFYARQWLCSGRIEIKCR